MRRALAFAVVLGLAGLASAANFDGERPLVCTLESASECDSDASCTTVASGELDLPDSFTVDFKSKRLRSPNGQRTSPIQFVDIGQSTLLAQGSQNGRAWSMAINRETGRMTGTIAEAEGAIVLAGTCAKAP